MTDHDRVVHVSMPGAEVVRYDRAARFYYEGADGTRKRIMLRDAIKFAMLPGSRVHENQPGGMRFDAALRKARTLRG